MGFSMEKEGGGKASLLGIPGGVFHGRHWGQGWFWEGVLGRSSGKELPEGVRSLEQDFWEGVLGKGFRKLREGILGRFLGKAILGMCEMPGAGVLGRSFGKMLWGRCFRNSFWERALGWRFGKVLREDPFGSHFGQEFWEDALGRGSRKVIWEGASGRCLGKVFWEAL